MWSWAWENLPPLPCTHTEESLGTHEYGFLLDTPRIYYFYVLLLVLICVCVCSSFCHLVCNCSIFLQTYNYEGNIQSLVSLMTKTDEMDWLCFLFVTLDDLSCICGTHILHGHNPTSSARRLSSRTTCLRNKVAQKRARLHRLVHGAHVARADRKRSEKANEEPPLRTVTFLLSPALAQYLSLSTWRLFRQALYEYA